jgi:hypothetical protein
LMIVITLANKHLHFKNQSSAGLSIFSDEI